MDVMVKAKNVTRWLIQAYGTETIKKGLWNSEYASGRWDRADSTANDCVYPCLAEHAAGGAILELGCGACPTAVELPFDAYSNFVGVDISDVAVEEAIRRSAVSGRAFKNRFERSDIVSYAPKDRFKVILFRDSIYYLPPGKIKSTLSRYANYLTKDGVFIARGHTGIPKLAAALEIVEENFTVLKRHKQADPPAIVVVFR